MSDDARLWQAVADLRRRLADLEAMEYAGNAHTLDGLHAATSGADAHVLATDASGNVRVDGHLLMPTPGQRRIEVPGTNIARYGVIEAVVRKQLVDNSPTAVFTVTTTDESGDVDGGSYSVFVHAVVHVSAAVGTATSAAKSFTAQFCRAMKAAAAGANSAVSEVVETASAATDPATRDIGTVTMAVTETSEFVQTVDFTVDVTGTSAAAPIITAFVQVVWGSFTTAPVLAAV